MQNNHLQSLIAAAPLFERWEWTARHKRRRKPTISSVAKQAIKAGATRATLAPDGTVSLEFGREIVPVATLAPGEPNEWDTIQ